MKPAHKVLLCILDGWGIRKERADNAILLAGTPNLDRSRTASPSPSCRPPASPSGLPEGQMGNSEVGHTNIGAGPDRLPGPGAHQPRRESRRAGQQPGHPRGDGHRPRRTARPSTCWGCVSPGGVHSSHGAPLRAAEGGARARAAQGLHPRVPRRARHAAAERAWATWRSWSASSRRPRPRPHRHRGRALLRHGPRQALGPRQAGLRRDGAAARARKAPDALAAVRASLRGEGDRRVRPAHRHRPGRRHAGGPHPRRRRGACSSTSARTAPAR